MLTGGFVKLDRSINLLYTNNDLRVYIHLLLSANYIDNTVYDTFIYTGQLLTSYGKIADQLGLTVSEIITSITHLEAINKIVWKGVKNKYSICTIVNYKEICSDKKYNFVMLYRSIISREWYKSSAAAKLYYYIILHADADNIIIAKPVYLQNALKIGHSALATALKKLAEDNLILYYIMSRQLYITINQGDACLKQQQSKENTDIHQPSVPAASEPIPDNPAPSSDNQIYY